MYKITHKYNLCAKNYSFFAHFTSKHHIFCRKNNGFSSENKENSTEKGTQTIYNAFFQREKLYHFPRKAYNDSTYKKSNRK